jgi:soluble lytic murein transglycosylase
LKHALLRLAAAVLLLVAAGVTHAAKLEPQDVALRAARDAFEAGNRSKLAKVAPQLEGHVLLPYVEYWQLFLGLPAARAEEVREFLSRYPGTALAEQLRTDWLKVLGRSGRWELFQEEYPAM